jgi:hypothetical protein
MSRNVVLVLGAILWVSFAVVAIVHAIAGDWMGPLIAVIVVTTGVVLYHARQRVLKTS